jgi:hypothetical protein
MSTGGLARELVLVRGTTVIAEVGNILRTNFTQKQQYSPVEKWLEVYGCKLQQQPT